MNRLTKPRIQALRGSVGRDAIARLIVVRDRKGKRVALLHSWQICAAANLC
jgi:hypothetical protein